MSRNRTDVSLVRLITPMNDGAATARSRLLGFAQAIFPKIDALLPKQGRLADAPARANSDVMDLRFLRHAHVGKRPGGTWRKAPLDGDTFFACGSAETDPIVRIVSGKPYAEGSADARDFSGIFPTSASTKCSRVLLQWWIVGSCSVVAGWEAMRQKRILFEKTVAAGSCVLDVGANVGFYTLLASVIVGAQGRVFAFEPVPANVAYLREHIRANGISNVEVFDVAVSDDEGRKFFKSGTDKYFLGRLSPEGELAVNCVSLDGMRTRRELRPPNLIKIDVEGAELAVLQGAAQLLAEAHPVIFLATHGAEVHRQCCDFLRKLGYTLNPIEGGSVEESSELIART